MEIQTYSDSIFHFYEYIDTVTWISLSPVSHSHPLYFFGHVFTSSFSNDFAILASTSSTITLVYNLFICFLPSNFWCLEEWAVKTFICKWTVQHFNIFGQSDVCNQI
jgi:hypothetical protein